MRDGGGLAGAVRAEHAVDGALLDEQVDAVDRPVVAEGLDEARRLDGGGGGRHGGSFPSRRWSAGHAESMGATAHTALTRRSHALPAPHIRASRAGFESRGSRSVRSSAAHPYLDPAGCHSWPLKRPFEGEKWQLAGEPFSSGARLGELPLLALKAPVRGREVATHLGGRTVQELRRMGRAERGRATARGEAVRRRRAAGPRRRGGSARTAARAPRSPRAAAPGRRA